MDLNVACTEAKFTCVHVPAGIPSQDNLHTCGSICSQELPHAGCVCVKNTLGGHWVIGAKSVRLAQKSDVPRNFMVDFERAAVPESGLTLINCD